MKNEIGLAFLPRVLLPWYTVNKRELPWRRDRDPYHIWVSEIMLQQTRVEAVRDYYRRFLEVLPTVESLANASQELLYKLWEGLGYYSRVRNMKKAAQVICEEFEGQFPDNYEGVLSLPGIGPYTAGAIASIAFNQKTPAVDGNVLRLFARLTNDFTPIDAQTFKKHVTDQLCTIYPDDAGNFTQALMELGATICGPNRKPACEICPCNAHCEAFIKGTAEQLPIKSPKKPRKIEEKTVFILTCDGEYALEKRKESGLLAGLWQFPNIPGKMEIPDAIAELAKLGIKVRDIKRRVERNHIFTHVEWDMAGIYIEVIEKTPMFTWLSTKEICEEKALPTAFRQFWEEAEHV